MDDFTECAGYSLMMKHFSVALHFNYADITLVGLRGRFITKNKKQKNNHESEDEKGSWNRISEEVNCQSHSFHYICLHLFCSLLSFTLHLLGLRPARVSFPCVLMAASPPKYLAFSLAAPVEDFPESTWPNASWECREPFPKHRPAFPLTLYENPLPMIHPFWCTEH